MNFTIENQKENRISRTTTQTVKHVIYSNVEVTITGWFDKLTGCSVWKKQGRKVSMIECELDLNKAIEIANQLITT